MKNSKAVKILAPALKAWRKAEKLSLRRAAGLIGVTASTLSRIENEKGSPDADTVAAVAGYLKIPVERVLCDAPDAPVAYYPDESLPEIVTAHLEKDENLTSENAARLSEIFRTAYHEFAGFEKK